ncbi:alpha/beta hydrolase [Peristeroidobacter soli]|uniref:alpha/beta hydrolase n=1 Tax=Peristeroidobacter soli TaxID=2497877 RepID=UPI00101BF3D7|nr:alpha/beta fold hydrolase [Peristeroidobacter soli]
MRVIARLFVFAAAALITGCSSQKPLLIASQGSIAVGGKIVGDPGKASLHCDHGVAEYQIPPRARAVNLLMWHSASAVAWQRRWDGGEGFQSIFVRRGYPVYLWDGPRVGRANWGCAETTYTPRARADQQNFVAWRFGLTYPSWFENVQFPKNDSEAWNQAMRARYDEFDTVANAQLESDAAAALADRIGPTVALTNSAGGLRALLTALKSDNIKGIVAYENVGWVYPQGEGPDVPEGPFGPVEVSLEEFRKLTRFPIQVVWGDNIEQSAVYQARLAESRRFVDIVNKHGGQAEVLVLPEAGLDGNTHLPFADLNNVAVADLLSTFLADHGLDRR